MASKSDSGSDAGAKSATCGRVKACQGFQFSAISLKARVLVSVAIVSIIGSLLANFQAFSDSEETNADVNADLYFHQNVFRQTRASDGMVDLESRRLLLSDSVNETLAGMTGIPLPFFHSMTDHEALRVYRSVQNRISNVRIVFSSLAWIFLMLGMLKLFYQPSVWILPFYEAVHVQVFFLLIILALIVTRQLWVVPFSFEEDCLALGKIVFQSMLLVWGAYALPRNTFAVVSLLEGNYDTRNFSKENTDAISDSDDNSDDPDDDPMEAHMEVATLFTYKHRHLGPSNSILVPLASSLLFIARPVLQFILAVMRHSVSESDARDLSERDLNGFFALVDFILTFAGALALGIPGFRYFHEMRNISNSQRWIWAMLQAFVILVTAEGVLVTWMATYKLATDMKAMMVLFEIAACAGMIELITHKNDDIRWIFKAYGELAKREAATDTGEIAATNPLDCSFWRKLRFVLNPLAPFAMKITKKCTVVKIHVTQKRIAVAQEIYNMYKSTLLEARFPQRTDEHTAGLFGCSPHAMPRGQHRYIMPYEPSPDLEDEFVRRNIWDQVTADIFSNNVRSHLIAAGVFACFLLCTNLSDLYTSIFDFLHISGDSKYLALLRNLLTGFLCYIATAIMLHGNNVFVHKNVYRIYAGLWIIVLLILALYQLDRFFHDPRSVGAAGTDLYNWLSLSITFVCMNTVIVVVIRFSMSENAAEFLMTQIAEQSYCKLVLQQAFPVHWPKVGSLIKVARAGNLPATAEVTKNHHNGEYDITYLDNHDGVEKHMTLLRKRMLPLSKDPKKQDTITQKDIPRPRKHAARVAFAQTFLQRFSPPSHFPIIVLIAIAITACAVMAIAAVAANAGSMVLRQCSDAQKLSEVVYNFWYEPVPEGCTKSAEELFRLFDSDRNGGISHKELPLYSFMHSLPSSLAKYMVPLDEFNRIWPPTTLLDNDGLVDVMCLLRNVTAEKVLEVKGVGKIVRSAYRTELTGDILISYMGKNSSKDQSQAILADAIGSFVPASLAEAAENGMAYLWTLADRNGNEWIEPSEWDTVALGMNFLIGRVPEIIGVLPCPDQGGHPEEERRLTKFLGQAAGIIKLTNWNFNDQLEKSEWMMFVNIIASLAGHGMAKKSLVDAFDYIAEGGDKISWTKVELLAGLLDKFVTNAANLPTIIGGGDFTARDMMKFLVTWDSNSLTREEARPFESVLASNSNAVRADMCLEAGFTAVDANKNNKLEWGELDDPRFGAAVKKSFGVFAIEKMKQSVKTIPKNCQKADEESSSSRRLDVESSTVEEFEEGTLDDDAGLFRRLHEIFQNDYIKMLTKAAELQADEPQGDEVARGDIRMLSDTSSPVNSSYNSSDNIFASAVSSVRAKTHKVKGVLEDISTAVDAFTTKTTDFTQWTIQGLSSDRARFAIHCLGVVLYGSNILATVFSVYIVMRTMNHYKYLFDQFRTNKVAYQGVENVKNGEMKNAYATVTFLPAQVAFSIMLGWVISFGLSFFLLGVLSLLMIWWEWSLENVGPYIVYFAVYLGSFTILRSCIIEKYIVAPSTGEIIRPRMFSFLWIVFIVYNFVFGVSLAIYRIIYMLVYCLLSACFIHYSIFQVDPDWFWLDPGYYTLLAAAYTAYERTNPIKNAFIALICPGTRQLYGPPKDYDVDSDDLMRRREQRARNRFNVALTKFRNPLVIQSRKPIPDAGKKAPWLSCCGDASGSGSDDDTVSEQTSLTQRVTR